LTPFSSKILENKNIGEKELHQGLGHFCLERYTLKDFHPKEFSQARKFNIKKNVLKFSCIDVCNPLPMKSLNNYWYFLAFIYDFLKINLGLCQ
jgi:hypothetical protein